MACVDNIALVTALTLETLERQLFEFSMEFCKFFSQILRNYQFANSTIHASLLEILPECVVHKSFRTFFFFIELLEPSRIMKNYFVSWASAIATSLSVWFGYNISGMELSSRFRVLCVLTLLVSSFSFTCIPYWKLHCHVTKQVKIEHPPLFQTETPLNLAQFGVEMAMVCQTGGKLSMAEIIWNYL